MEEADEVEDADPDVECGMVSMSAGGEEVAGCDACACIVDVGGGCM